MPSTIRDVAREAGVSVATVSRVFNDSGPVRESTRRSVVDAARRLQYSPNTAARSLSLRRTHAVGVVLPQLHGHFFSEVIEGIDQVVKEHDYHLLISGCHDDRGDIGTVLRFLRGRVDGLVLIAPELGAHALLPEIPERLPLVLLNTYIEGTELERITIDDYGGAYRMMSHLLALGHRRIALIAGAERNQNSRERLRAYRDALRAHDVAVDESLIAAGDGSEHSGRVAALRLVGEGPLPDAIFALNDAMALGALEALRQCGLSVPEDVAVVGFDDAPEAAHSDPPLTTVRVDVAELGRRASDRLFHLMNGGNGSQPKHETLAAEVVVRDSCGAHVMEVR